MGRILAIGIVTGVILGLFAPAGLRAEDDEAPEGLVTQIFDVQSLTQGTTSFIPAILGTTSPDMVSDEEAPLFGAEGEAPILPLGTIDDLIEILQATVDPVFWEVTEGARIYNLCEDSLAVRATPEVLALLARRLAAFERRNLATLRVDLVVVAAGSEDLGPAGALDEARARTLLDAGRIVRTLTISALVDQLATARTGIQRAYVQDYDVEVAKKAKIGDPIVGVVSYGLQVRVQAEPSGRDGKLYLHFEGDFTEPLPRRYHNLGQSTWIDLPTYRTRPIRFDRIVAPGIWYLAPGATFGERPTAFLVRARLVQADAAPAAVHPMPAWPAPDKAPLETRFFDVRDLNAAPGDRAGRDVYLVPSNFTPPEPPGLADPMPILPIDGLVEFLRELAPARTWNRTGAFLDARNGHLVVRQTPTVLDAVARQLDTLRTRFLRTTIVTFDLLEVPTHLALQLGADPETGGGCCLSPRALAGLDATLKAGDATRLGRVRLTSLGGAREVVEDGVVRHYLQDYEVEIAEEATIPNPVIHSFFEGLVVDCRPATTSAGDGVLAEVRFTASRLTKLDTSPSPHGPIDLPDLAILKVRSSVYVPLGQTALVLAGGDGERTRILLLRPEVQAP